MMDNLKSKSVYVILGILILALILFKMNKNNELNDLKVEKKLSEDIRFSLRLRLEKANSIDVFCNAFSTLIPFLGINELEKIDYANKLIRKCENSEPLSETQEFILNSLEVVEKTDRSNLFGYLAYVFYLGYASVIILLFILLKLIKQIKNEDTRKAFKFYLIFCFIANLAFLGYYNSESKGLYYGKLSDCTKKLFQEKVRKGVYK